MSLRWEDDTGKEWKERPEDRESREKFYADPWGVLARRVEGTEVSLQRAVQDLHAHEQDYQQALDAYREANEEVSRAWRNVQAAREALALAIKRECALSDASAKELGKWFEEVSP